MKFQIIVAIVCWLMFFNIGQADEGYFDSNGVKIRYLVEGQGEPVLLIHGFTVNVEKNWGIPGTLTSLAKDYHVIAFDNRGHGKSDKPNDAKQYGTEMVEDAIRLLDHLKINKAHVVGYSMGGAITLKLLDMHPERVLSATLGGSGGVRENSSPLFFELLADSLEQGKGLGPLIELLTPAGKPKPTGEQINQINRWILAENDNKALGAAIRGMPKLAVSDENLKANRVPTLAIVGEIDPLKKGVDELETLKSNLKVVVIKGADHNSAAYSPEFVRELKEFLGKQTKQENGGKPTPAE